MRSARWVAAAAVLAVAGCSGGTPPQASLPTGTLAPTTPGPPRSTPAKPTTLPPLPPATLDLKDCTDRVRLPDTDRKLSFDCGTLSVPLDYADPAGEKLTVFVIRARMAGQRDRIGSLAVNPGGPGGSGVNTAVQLSVALPEEVLRRYDLIGFDPRGVGLSTPLRCVPDALKDEITAESADVASTAEYVAQAALARRQAQGCQRKYGGKLAHFNTVETARDLDRLREALHEIRLNYLGYSYGTLLGAVYATLFPDRVGAFVLDGAVDPTAGELANSEAQARGFEDAYTQFAASCLRSASCPLAPDPRAFLQRLLHQTKAHPIPSGSGDTRRVTDGNVLLAVVSALYSRGDWDDLTRALADAGRGDGGGILDLDDQYNQRQDDGTFSNLLDVNLAVNCADRAATIPDATIRATLAGWRKKYPLFGAPLALTLLSCSSWTAPRHPLPAVSAPRAASPILVVGTRHDPATPYASAQKLRAALGRAVLLSWDGDGHTAYPKTSCVARAVDAYLLDRTLPAANATCPAA